LGEGNKAKGKDKQMVITVIMNIFVLKYLFMPAFLERKERYPQNILIKILFFACLSPMVRHVQIFNYKTFNRFVNIFF
jgi:hypothetical protein